MQGYEGYWKPAMADPGKKGNYRLLPDRPISSNLKFTLEELTQAGKFAILCKRFQKTLT